MGTVVVDMSELDGLAELIAAEPFKAAAVGHAAVKAIGAQVDTRAEAAAPRERPQLATKLIVHKTWKDSKGSHTDVFTVPDDEGRPVGMFREYGTSVLPPQAFLTIQAPWAEAALETFISSKLEVLGK